MDHFVQGWRDQAGQADDVTLLFPGGLQDGFRRYHHAQVNHLVIVTGEHHTDDVLADIVHVALYRGHQDAAIGLAVLGFLRLDIRLQIGHSLFHDSRGFHHLGQEHLAGAEEVTDHVHAVHQRPLDDIQWSFAGGAGGFGILDDIVVDALDQRVLEALVDRQLAPGQIFLARLAAAVAAVFLRDFQQGFGPVRIAVQDYVLDFLAQFLGQFVVHRQHAGVDDTHIQARLDSVEQEDRVDCLAHGVVAPEREGHIGHTTGNIGAGQVLANPARGLDKIHRVVVVLFNTGGDGKDVRIKNDVARCEPHLVDQHVVTALADLGLALESVRLALLVEGHDDHRGAVAQAQARFLDKICFAFFQADGVDDGFALDALQPGLDHLPLGGVHHKRHFGDIWLRRGQVEEAAHGGDGIQHRLVHVEVDHLRAVFHLGGGNLQGGVVVLVHDQPLEGR